MANSFDDDGSDPDDRQRNKLRSTRAIADHPTVPPEGTYTEQLREAILEATSRIIEDEGVQAATPTRIFAATGIARSTIYRYWPDKVELLDEALRRRAKPARAPLDQSARSDLERVIRQTLERFQEDAFVRMLATTLGHADVGDEDVNARWRKLANDLANSRSEEFQQFLLQAQSRGRIAGELSVEEVGALALGPCLYLKLLSGQALSETFVNQIVVLIRDLVEDSEIEEKPSDGRKRNA